MKRVILTMCFVLILAQTAPCFGQIFGGTLVPFSPPIVAEVKEPESFLGTLIRIDDELVPVNPDMSFFHVGHGIYELFYDTVPYGQYMFLEAPAPDEWSYDYWKFYHQGGK